jgi:hypothetical protein
LFLKRRKKSQVQISKHYFFFFFKKKQESTIHPMSKNTETPSTLSHEEPQKTSVPKEAPKETPKEAPKEPSKEAPSLKKASTPSTTLKAGTTIKNRLCRKTGDFGRVYKSQSSTANIEQFVFSSSKKSNLDDFREDKKRHFVDVYEASNAFDENKQPIQLPLNLVLHDKTLGTDKARRNNNNDTCSSERFLVSYDLDLIRAIEGWRYNLVYQLDANEVVLGIDSLVLKEKDSRYGEGQGSRNQAPLKLEDFTKARSATVSSRLREQKRNNKRKTNSGPSNEMEAMTQLIKSKKDYELVMISVLADGLSYSQPYLSQ